MHLPLYRQLPILLTGYFYTDHALWEQSVFCETTSNLRGTQTWGICGLARPPPWVLLPLHFVWPHMTNDSLSSHGIPMPAAGPYEVAAPQFRGKEWRNLGTGAMQPWHPFPHPVPQAILCPASSPQTYPKSHDSSSKLVNMEKDSAINNLLPLLARSGARILCTLCLIFLT